MAHRNTWRFSNAVLFTGAPRVLQAQLLPSHLSQCVINVYQRRYCMIPARCLCRVSLISRAFSATCWIVHSTTTARQATDAGDEVVP